MKRMLSVIALVAVFTAGCATARPVPTCDFDTSGPRPAWADLDYPTGNRVYGIGISSSAMVKPNGQPNTWIDKKKSAQIAAKADLAEQLGTEVYSRLEQDLKVSEHGDQSRMDVDIHSLVRTTTQRQVGFISFTDTWHDGDACVVYVLAEMPVEYIDMLIGQFKEVLP